MTPVLVLWDTSRDCIAHDPAGRYGDGLCPLAVYLRPELARAALEQAAAQHQRVEVRQMVLVSPPVRAELPTLDLDELERRDSVSPAVAALWPATQCRSELEADG